MLGWNCRGAGDSRTVQEMERLVHTYRPKLVFLSETRQNKVVVENLRWRLGLKHVVTFHEPGKGGGLALFWDESVEVELNKIGNRIIDVIVHDLPKGIKWRCTFVYGEPRRELRHVFWDLLGRLRREWTGSWLCCGDFNEVLTNEEHYGSRERSSTQMELFRECLDVCNLVDLGFSGPKFTWSNRQDAQCNVHCRLDRGVANSAFSTMFPSCAVENVITTSSDHYAVHMQLVAKPLGRNVGPVGHSFRYEAAW